MIRNRIKEYRARHNMKQEELARLVGVRRETIGNLENGDRMVVYVNNRRFVKADELVPVSRVMSTPNVTNVCYDTAYMANASEVQLMYQTSMLYVDGI